MSRPSLFDAGPRQRWTGSRALVVIGDSCPACAATLTVQTVDTAALFIHGGYGATRRSTWSVCPNGECRWSIERIVEEVKPEIRPPMLGDDAA